MIDLGNLSYEEKEAIEEFRKRMEKELDDPILSEDETLYYRFLKARDFDIEKAEKMLRNHIIWRKAKQVTKIREEFVPKEVFVKHILPSNIGMDKKGDFVEYSPIGILDGRETWKCMQLNNYFDHWIWYAERCLYKNLVNITKKQGRAAKTHPIVVIIFDLDQLTFSNATSKISAEMMLGILGILLDNYPETVSSVYIINAPRYYTIPFAILKTLMSNAMLKKLSVFGKHGWKEALLKSIDVHVLPAFLGGNRTDPDGDPLCKTFVSHDPIPVEYYLSDEDRYFKDKTQIQTVYIPKNSRKEVEVIVTEEGSVIHWEFLVKNKDIGIGLLRKALEVIEILPVFRYYTVDGTTKMSYKTKTAGKYILVFDNSFSWIKSKEVEYTVKVVIPGNSRQGSIAEAYTELN